MKPQGKYSLKNQMKPRTYKNTDITKIVKTGLVLAQKQKYRSMEKEKKSTEMNPCTDVHLIYDKGCKNIQWRKTVSPISVPGKKGQLHVHQ